MASASCYQSLITGAWDQPSSSEEEEYSEEEYADYLASPETVRLGVPKQDGSVSFGICDPVLVLRVILSAKAFNSFLRLNRFWNEFLNTEQCWKDYWHINWPGGFIPPEHKHKPYATICKLKWNRLTLFEIGSKQYRISKTLSRVIESDERVFIEHSRNTRRGDICYSQDNRIIRCKGNYYTVVEGPARGNEELYPDCYRPTFRTFSKFSANQSPSPIEGKALVPKVNVANGTYDVTERQVTQTIPIPWNHFGDKLVRLWKKFGSSTQHKLVVDIAGGGALYRYVCPRVERKGK